MCFELLVRGFEILTFDRYEVEDASATEESCEVERECKERVVATFTATTTDTSRIPTVGYTNMCTRSIKKRFKRKT